MSTIDTDQNAGQVIEAINGSDDKEAVEGALAEESAKDQPRSTVVAAAEARLEVLNLPGEVGGQETGLHAILLDADGEPVLVDGEHVVTPLTPGIAKEADLVPAEDLEPAPADA